MTQQQQTTLGGGCFWCLEAVFQQLDGVLSIVSGYAGGTLPHPSYEQVCTGMTGHAEVLQIAFDPSKLSFEKLLEVFWRAHDPTTLNRQGADRGTQYRSAIYCHDEGQRARAEKAQKQMDESGLYADPLVTEIAPLGIFYPAEDYHQDYFRRNPNAPYCAVVIRPKLLKLGMTG